MELTLGPVLFEWKREELLRFYDEIADMDIDRVYIGEVVCSKKIGLGRDEIAKIAGKLTESGKKVVLSTLAVISNEEELDFTRRLLDLPYAVEANDMGVLNIVDPKTREVFAGPHITAYNVPSVEFLQGVGINRITFPVELPKGSMSHILANTGVFGEVFVHGKVPLAFSWRCYTSRAHGLNKTGCRHHCGLYPDGLELKTMENEEVFTVNGTSLLSANTYTLVEAVEDLKETGAGAIRISPQHRNTGKVIEVFRKRMRGEMGPGEGLARLKELCTGGFSNGWYCGGAGKDYLFGTVAGTVAKTGGAKAPSV